MNINRIKIIFLKDWKELLKSRQALLPMIILPLLFIIVLPAASILSSGQIQLSPQNAEFLQKFPDRLFPNDVISLNQKMVYAMIVYFFAPFFLIIPVMISSIIAANSFAGEKEQKTIEGLLYTPITDRELIIGKILVSLVPAVIITWLSFVLYGIIANVLGYHVMQRIYFPTLTWIIMMVWLVPALSFLSLSIVVAVSFRASNVWEAQQISAFMVIPIVGMVISQATGVLYISPLIVFISGIIFFFIDFLAYKWIVKSFSRERVVTKFM